MQLFLKASSGRIFQGCSFLALLYLWLCADLQAQILTSDLELKLVPNVGASWQTVSLENSYTDPIIVCTYNLVSDTHPSATTRIQNITSSSFQLRIQQFENSSVVTASDVHCIISDEGAYDDGDLKYEARKVLSTNTSGLAVGWGAGTTENVSADVTQSYANPHVLGQVMSFADSKASVFWNFDCDNRGNGAFFSGQADGICVGKHIGQINGMRADEMIGYIVVEAGTGTVNDISFAAAVGPDTGAGVGNSPPYSYSVTGDFDIGILSQAGEDGGQGGWTILYGADPLPSGSIHWATEEEVVAGDTSRTHTSENIGYWIFDNNQSPQLEVSKDVAHFAGSASDYSLPGSDVIYTLNVENVGSGSPDDGSLVLIDAIPAEVTFYNDDIDGLGPETDVVSFTDVNSGLTLDVANNVKFSDAATQPADMSECNYNANTGYDPDISYICISPEGTMREGTITASSFSVSFRAAIK